MPYYAVAKGRSAGVYTTWSDCKENVDGYSGAKYKKFATKSEAQNFVNQRSESSYAGLFSHSGHSSNNGGVSSSTGVAARSKSASKPEKIFVDGAARGNGKMRCPQSGYGVYYGSGDPRNRAVPLSDVDDVSKVKPTNQRAELHAMHHALKNIQKEHSSNPSSSKSYEIHTDSTYTKNAIDTWADSWKKKNWKTSTGSDVANRDLIERTHVIYTNLKQSGVPLELVHVRGHSGNEGNEEADRLANEGADQMR